MKKHTKAFLVFTAAAAAVGVAYKKYQERYELMEDEMEPEDSDFETMVISEDDLDPVIDDQIFFHE